MKSLVYKWIAIFKDGSIIKQFNEDGTENLFILVKERFSDLVFFNLEGINNTKLFSVDLVSCIISYNCIPLTPIENNTKSNIRLITFRRHKHEISTQTLESLKEECIYGLGYQYLNKVGQNKQIILYISEDGSFEIKD